MGGSEFETFSNGPVQCVLLLTSPLYIGCNVLDDYNKPKQLCFHAMIFSTQFSHSKMLLWFTRHVLRRLCKVQRSQACGAVLFYCGQNIFFLDLIGLGSYCGIGMPSHFMHFEKHFVNYKALYLCQVVILKFMYPQLFMVGEQSSPVLKFCCLVQVILINFLQFQQRERERQNWKLIHAIHLSQFPRKDKLLPCLWISSNSVLHLCVSRDFYSSVS